MAKILSVSLLSIPDVIHVGDNKSDVTIVTEIEFHKLDIAMGMEYSLHILVYDVHGELDTPFVLPNWDESKVFPIPKGRKDDYLGGVVKLITASEKLVEIQTPIALYLGKVNHEYGHISRTLEAFATMTPAIGRASKWSKPFTSKIVY